MVIKDSGLRVPIPMIYVIRGEDGTVVRMVLIRDLACCRPCGVHIGKLQGSSVCGGIGGMLKIRPHAEHMTHVNGQGGHSQQYRKYYGD